MIASSPSCSLIYHVWSWPWNRHIPRRFELLAKSYGLTVTHEHDGGWTLRYHLIVTVGDDRRVRGYARHLNRWNRLRRDLPDYIDLWERLRQHTPTTPEEDPCP